MTYDCFNFFNECDLLEIRFNLLDPYVDFFVLGESTETFSGKEKPLYFLENTQRFKKWAHKVIHIVSPELSTSNAFIRAGFQKEYLKNGLKDAKDEDTIYFGDVDEIWKPKQVEGIANLKQLNYCYYLNNRSSEEWIGTIVGKWKNIKHNSFNFWRARHDNVLEDGGWHFTNMGGADQIREKLDSYDHQEMNTNENRVLLEDRIKDGEDYAGRQLDWQGKPFSFTVDESQLPEYIINNKLRYEEYFK